MPAVSKPSGAPLGSRRFAFVFLFPALLTTLITSCSGTLYGPRSAISASDTKIIVDALIADLPLPPDAKIRLRDSVILGSGSNWGGRIGFVDPLSPAETLLFFRETAPASGWALTSSTVGSSIIVVFEKPDRIATVEIFKGPRFGKKSDVTISVVPRTPDGPRAVRL